MAKNVATPAELRSRSRDQLRSRIVELKKEQFNLRFQQATGQLESTHRFREVRKELARVMTVLGEMDRSSAGGV